MLMIILFAIVWVVGYSIASYRDDWADWFTWIMGTVIGGVVAGIVGLVVALVFGSIFNVQGDWDKTGEASLEQLSDGVNSSGSFFLGSGAIDEEPVFYFYQQRDGYYTLEHVKADHAHIVQTTDTPRVLFETFHTDSLWTLDGNDGRERVTFYIPEGSITNSFSLNGPTN